MFRHCLFQLASVSKIAFHHWKMKLTIMSYISEGPGREGLKKIFSDAR